MPQPPLEQMKYRIMEIEMYISMAREMPEDMIWVESFIDILAEKVQQLKSCYRRLGPVE